MNIDEKPLVTVCVPTYNTGKYLKESLSSILNQDYPNYEVFVIDNASTDNTREIVKDLQQTHDFKYSCNDSNIGDYGNYTKCFEYGAGEYISVYHSDDVYNPSIISESVKAFLKDPVVGLVFSLKINTDESGNIIDKDKYPSELKKQGTDYYFLPQLFRSFMINTAFGLATPTMMMKRRLFYDFGGFDKDKYGSAADLALWLKISEKNGVAIIDKHLINYRRTSNQGIRNKTITKNGFLEIIREYRDRFPEYFIHYNKYKIIDASKAVILSMKQNNHGIFDNYSKIYWENLNLKVFFSSMEAKKRILIVAGLFTIILEKFSISIAGKFANWFEKLRNKMNKHVV